MQLLVRGPFTILSHPHAKVSAKKVLQRMYAGAKLLGELRPNIWLEFRFYSFDNLFVGLRIDIFHAPYPFIVPLRQIKLKTELILFKI